MIYSLIDTIWWFLQPAHWGTIFKVAAGLGFVIFVHELGHFAVAKACGVRCDKFYIGFDVPLGRFFDWLLWLPKNYLFRSPGEIKLFQRIIPQSLVKYKYGETTYGVGIVPLGGYVKMLGQDDDPAQAAREMKMLERQRAAEAAGQNVPEEERIPDERVQALLDPRSYQTKSVPQRMAIITAGVIMNVIFAVVMGTMAYMMGVEKPLTVLGDVLPGGAGWQVGLQPGDTVVEIAGEPVKYFEQLQAQVQYTTHDRKEGIEFVVERPGASQNLTFDIQPDTKGGAPVILVRPAHDLRFSKGVAATYSPLGRLQKSETDKSKKFQADDRILTVDGAPVTNAFELEKILFEKRDRALTVEVERRIQEGETVTLKTIALTIPPAAKRELQFAMTMGPIVAVKANSPAAKAGIKPGDVLKTIDGAPLGDPLKADEAFRTLSGKRVKLGIDRVREKGKAEVQTVESERIEIELEPSSPAYYEPTLLNPSISALGVTFKIEPIVSSVVPGGIADKAGIKPGQSIETLQLLQPAEPPEGSLFRIDGQTYKLMAETAAGIDGDWAVFDGLLQNVDPTRVVRLGVREGETQTTIDLSPITSEIEFDVDRGFSLQDDSVLVKYPFGDAVVEALKTTGDKLTMVLGMLRKLTSGEISVKNLGGPVMIASAAGSAANAGFPELLLFLVMLSANLAVINMLPIPALDGGHFVFLLYEGITGKPMNARVFEVLLSVGMMLLLTLMLFVLSLDFGLISRR